NTVGVGIGDAYAIYVDSSSAVVEYNRVSNAALPVSNAVLPVSHAVLPNGSSDSFGIFVCNGTDVLVVDNRIITMTFGVFYDLAAGGKHGRNLTSGVPTPSTGGTAAGGNND